MVSTVMQDGRLLYRNEDQAVYYLNNNLYFIADALADTGYTYFLHYCAEDGTTTTDDFKFSDNRIDTSVLHKKIAVKEIPVQKFAKIGFGQYYGETRFWQQFVETSDFLIVPQTISVLDFTDDNWTNGYSNSENCFLAAEIRLENCMLAGEKIALPDGRETVITGTEVAWGYQRIYTADNLSAYGERSYSVE